MRIAGLLLMIALCSISESHVGLGDRSKQELLVRNKRRWVLNTIEIQEEDPGPYPKIISRVVNDFKGTDYYFHISGHGVDEDPVNVFSIDKETGQVYAHRAVDREEYEETFHIKFDIRDSTTNQVLDQQLAFDVEIMDINDNAPTFDKPQMTIEVMENTPEGYLPGRLQVTDRDEAETPNSKIIVSLISQEPKEPKISMIQMYDTQVQLVLKSGCFNYDKIKKYEVRLKASDHGQPSRSSTAVITLNITDANTHPPMFKEKEYQGEVMELQTQEDVLRVAVEDKDTPNTPGWRAQYFFVKGNEEGYYKIETDPKTNEGVLSVVKGLDYERIALVTLEVGVKNEEPLWVCKDNPPSSPNKDFYDSAVITIKMKDVNDPPVFLQNPVNLHVFEEEKPGTVLFIPEVTDVDSDVSQIRYVLLEDPQNWVSIDRETGKITSVEKMDRESPVLNDTGIYSILIGAIDNDEPPATATCTVQIHLQDIDDNKPHLENKAVTICANKDNGVRVAARDADDVPYAGPFYFSLKNDEKILKQWTLDPSSGHEYKLVSKKVLHYGNYLVPLEIRDQQNILTQETLEVMVCDCEEKTVCRPQKKISISLSPAGIGLVFAGILFFLLLLLIFSCQCRKVFKELPFKLEEGNETIMTYNQEGGMSDLMSNPALFLTPPDSAAVARGLKTSPLQASQSLQVRMDDGFGYRSSGLGTMNSGRNPLGGWSQRDTLRRNGPQTNVGSDISGTKFQSSSWKTNGTNSYWGGFSRRSQLSEQHIADYIDRRLYTIDGKHAESADYRPFLYAYEGQGSECVSLDEISLIPGDNLTFLDNLGPSFNTLGQICQQTYKT